MKSGVCVRILKYSLSWKICIKQNTNCMRDNELKVIGQITKKLHAPIDALY